VAAVLARSDTLWVTPATTRHTAGYTRNIISTSPTFAPPGFARTVQFLLIFLEGGGGQVDCK
jgi:hypothetical protein